MTGSKMNREDAQEWLESLQQVGEGWYRQVALAVRANAHKALGMERREFAARIGGRLIDPRPAILELHQEGMSQKAIADVLGVSDSDTVRRILREEGRVALSSGEAERSSSAGESAALRSDVDSTSQEITTAEEKLLRAEVKKLKAEVKKARERGLEALRQERDRQEASKTPAQRFQEEREAEAFANAAIEPVMKMTAAVDTGAIVSLLFEARGMLTTLIDQQSVGEEVIDTIRPALDMLNREFDVAFNVAQLDRDR